MKQNQTLKLFTIILFMIPVTFLAQNIKGKVTDISGANLPFINIIEKGTSNGVVTDDNGEFSIKVKNLPTTFIVSSMGFET